MRLRVEVAWHECTCEKGSDHENFSVFAVNLHKSKNLSHRSKNRSPVDCEEKFGSFCVGIFRGAKVPADRGATTRIFRFLR